MSTSDVRGDEIRMRFPLPLPLLSRTLHRGRIHLHLGPRIFARIDIQGLARGVFDAGGGDGDWWGLVGEGVGPIDG